MTEASKTGKIPAVFIDRDGVINEDKSYVFKIEDLTILPKVPEALKTLKDHGFLLIVITNQSGVARGYFNIKDVENFNQEIKRSIMKSVNVEIDDFYICPHHIKGTIPPYNSDCDCRKPKTKLVEDSQKKWNIDLSKSFMIGDKKSDIDLAKNVGIPGIQINNGLYDLHSNPEFMAKNLLEATEFIIIHKKNN